MPSLQGHCHPSNLDWLSGGTCPHPLLSPHHPPRFLLYQGQNCGHYPLCRSTEPQVSITAIAFQMKGKHPGSPCSCQGSLRPKLQQRMLQCGSAGWVAGRSSQQVCRKLGTTVAPHGPASTKATGEASRIPTGCSFQERKRLCSADVSLEQRVVLLNASSVPKLTQSVTSVAI